MKTASCAYGIIFAVSALVGGERTALAQDTEEGFVESFKTFFKPNWERDFSVAVGVKVWLNDWTANSFLTTTSGFGVGNNVFSISATDISPDLITSDIEPTPIPQVAIAYKRLIIIGSYYPETSFDFDTVEAQVTTNISGNVEATVTNNISFEPTAEREEWDVALGVSIFHPYVSILGGYKQIDQEFRFNIPSTQTISVVGAQNPAPVSGENSSGADIKISGPIVGISGAAPFGNSDFGMYGSYAHGFMDADITNIGQPTETTSADYDVAELAFFYAPDISQWLPQKLLSGTTFFAGYRYQNIETNRGEMNPRTDVTKGFMAGLNLNW
jgi:hypothetical protein